jgi:hypothetical protein
MLQTKGLLERAAVTAGEIDRLISELNLQLGEIVPLMQKEKRPHHAGMVIAFRMNLRDSFYRKLSGELKEIRNLSD